MYELSICHSECLYGSNFLSEKKERGGGAQKNITAFKVSPDLGTEYRPHNFPQFPTQVCFVQFHEYPQ